MPQFHVKIAKCKRQDQNNHWHVHLIIILIILTTGLIQKPLYLESENLFGVKNRLGNESPSSKTIDTLTPVGASNLLNSIKRLFVMKDRVCSDQKKRNFSESAISLTGSLRSLHSFKISSLVNAIPFSSALVKTST